MKRKLLILLFNLSFILISNFFLSQAGIIIEKPLSGHKMYTPKQIDSLQYNEIVYLRDERRFKELFLLSTQLIEASEKIQYSKGVITSYLNIANALFLIYKYDESLRFLKLAEKHKGMESSNHLQSWLYIEYGNNYDALGFHKKASETLDKAIRFGIKIKDPQNKGFMLHYAYNHKAVCRYMAKFPDSSLYYFKKAYEALPDDPRRNLITITNIGDWYSRHNKLDSAKYFLDKASGPIMDSQDFLFQKACLYWGYGTLSAKQKRHEEALDYYKKAEHIFKQLNTPNDLVGLYKLFSNEYDSLNLPQKSKEYLLRHTILKDSLNSIKEPTMDTFVVHFLNEQEREEESRRNRLYYIIGGIFVISIGIALLGIFYYRKNKRKEFLLTENEIMISQKDKEMEELKQKVNETFEEIIQLAKENSPEFWGRFQEIYPEFREKMLEINPGLKTSELILSAYIYLGFNTKDIADYTFKAVQTIKNNKYNLRKRLNVPPQDDIILWIRNRTDS
ncbi:tetratricopeptide (TPR) repeat protein [Chryseobacterium defluvii]|uniref:Tetratricopeptide (TPR) repeat protein n=1 Tax=Chryseobacterium defluvii TaxID=160396 RepID=A0A840KC22_9FLAO|nr:hypothetical protein [Chryseobacterium defluvii]MBB4805548.1 tetratricopeptide (TPR) repeat protein [Chryseobacterium defluvii]